MSPSGRLNPFWSFALAGLIGMVAIGGASVLASQRAGQTEAMNDVRALTQVVAKTVVEPNLSPELIDGDPSAIASLDAIVTSRVLDGTTVRVKLWDANGRIVYSDEPRLIGETYELGDDKSASLRSGEVVSELSSLQGPENRFEVDAEQMLEVYLPLNGPDGEPLLYESYFDVSGVTESAQRIRAEFVPIIVAALALMEALHLGLAAGLNRRLRRDQADRERLLQQAIDASDLERRRIAGDLHDGVVQDLVGTLFAVSAAAESAAAHIPELATDLRAASIGTRRSLQSLRSLLVDIYPPNLDEQGLESAVHDLVAPAANLGIETDVTIATGDEPSLESTALVYRVVQEAVRNVFRHAKASRLTIDVEEAYDAVVATIEDDGSGFSTDDVASNGHLGLRLLRDLTADAGATFVVESTPGSGTKIRLEVPR